MLKTSNPQINLQIEAIDNVVIPHQVLGLIAMLVEECNHKDMLIEGMRDQIPG